MASPFDIATAVEKQLLPAQARGGGPQCGLRQLRRPPRPTGGGRPRRERWLSAMRPPTDGVGSPRARPPPGCFERSRSPAASQQQPIPNPRMPAPLALCDCHKRLVARIRCVVLLLMSGGECLEPGTVPTQSVNLLCPPTFFKGRVPVRVVAKAIGMDTEVVHAIAWSRSPKGLRVRRRGDRLGPRRRAIAVGARKFSRAPPSNLPYARTATAPTPAGTRRPEAAPPTAVRPRRRGSRQRWADMRPASGDLWGGRRGSVRRRRDSRMHAMRSAGASHKVATGNDDAATRHEFGAEWRGRGRPAWCRKSPQDMGRCCAGTALAKKASPQRRSSTTVWFLRFLDRPAPQGLGVKCFMFRAQNHVLWGTPEFSTNNENS